MPKNKQIGFWACCSLALTWALGAWGLMDTLSTNKLSMCLIPSFVSTLPLIEIIMKYK